MSYYITRTSGWFRLFGYGVAWKDTSVHKLLFSERNGLVKCYKIGRWSFRWIT